MVLVCWGEARRVALFGNMIGYGPSNADCQEELAVAVPPGSGYGHALRLPNSQVGTELDI